MCSYMRSESNIGVNHYLIGDNVQLLIDILVMILSRLALFDLSHNLVTLRMTSCFVFPITLPSLRHWSFVYQSH